VGKTHVAANLAVLAARKGMRVLIIDADLGLSNVEILYGIKPKFHLGHVLDGTATIEEVLMPGPGGVTVLPAGSGVQELTHLGDDQKRRIVEALDPLEDRFDLVLVDTGAGIGANVLFFAGAAQEAILVVKVISQQAGLRRFDVLVNLAAGDGPARDLFARLSQVTERFLTAQIRYLGYLPRDENVHRAAMVQRPLVDLFPASPSVRALSSAANRLLDEPAPIPVDGGLKFLWHRLFRDAASPV
jgi:flagellar biosynthesis protein FlhG